MLKDYYKILELQPTANQHEVKKSFRRLALLYHPDTNQNNQFAEAWYRELQEAYHTLTNATLRNAYLAQRWLLQSRGEHFADSIPLTPYTILKNTEQLKIQVNELDHHRMDHKQLQELIMKNLSDNYLNILIKNNDANLNIKYFDNIIKAAEPLPYKYLLAILAPLDTFCMHCRHLQTKLKRYKLKRKQLYIYEKNQMWIVMLITLLLCILIFGIGNES